MSGQALVLLPKTSRIWKLTPVVSKAYLDAHTNLTEIEASMDLLWWNNITSSKVNLGLAFYGRSFTITSSDCDTPGCPYLSAGDAGECSASAGILLSSEIEQIITDNNLTPVLYSNAAVKTITWDGDQWVSFDDEETFKLKADFAKSQCLGGVLVWSVDYDDSNNTLSQGLAAALGNEINVDTTTGLALTLDETSSTTTTTTSVGGQDSYCRFTNCGETCPSGFTSIVRGDKKSQLMLDSTECWPGSGDTQTLCCPTTTDVPTCQWRGFHNNGKCKGGCDDGEAEVGTNSAGCKSGYQSACCTTTASTKPYSECSWTSSCESDDTCPSGYSNLVVGSRDGWGGRSSCKNGKTYNYCCSSVPDAFTNCAWKGFEVAFVNTAYCSDTCPSGTIRIAEQSDYGKTPNVDGCIWGNEAVSQNLPEHYSQIEMIFELRHCFE